MSDIANGTLPEENGTTVSPPVEAAPVRELTPAQLLQAQAEAAAAAAAAINAKNTQKKASKLDVSSEDAFPTLGGAPTRTTAAATWGAGSTPNFTAAVQESNWTPSIATGQRQQIVVPFLKHEKRPVSELRGKSVADVLRDIARKTGTKIDAAHNNAQGSTNYLIYSGTQDDREAAKKELIRELKVKTVVKVPVPAVIRASIIGAKGAKINELQKKTFTNIKIPNAADDEQSAEFEDDVMVDVIIEGDAEGCAAAAELINQIVKERVIKVTRTISCCGSLYPFIQGANKANIEEWEKSVDRVIVPDYHTTTTPANVGFSAPSAPISVIGEKSAVEQVVAEIKEKIAALEAANHTPYKHSIVQPMRQLLLTRNNAQIIKEVFAETGCAVVVPPEQAPVVYIIGPAQQLPQAVAAITTKMEPHHSITLDIKNAYYVAPSMPAPAKGKKPAPPTPEQQAAILLAAKTAKAYSIDVARHMRKMGTLKALEKELGVDIIYPSDTTLYDLNLFCPLLIVGKTQEAVNAAKGRVVEIANKYRSSEGRVSHLYIEPLHFKHIHGKDGKGAKKLAAATSVELLFPEDAEDDQITLFYEGEATEAEEIAAAIEQAKEQVNELVKDQIEIVSKVLPITQELHEKVQGERGTIINALNPSSVHIQFGAPKARFGRPAPASAENAENTITLRGPPAGVSSTAAAIVQFLKENEDKETADVVTEPYTYPAKFSGNLIGAKGANINKLRDDYGVEIKLSEGSGEITGVQVCVDAARRKLNAQVKEFEDKAVLHVKVPQQFHSVIIGPGGSTVRRLEERYDVRINFPKAAKEDGEAPKQAADEIVIKGSKKGAEEARKEIDELYKYEAENAHTATISVLAKSVGYMFKNASKDIKALRDESSARIIIPQEDKDADPESTVEIKIRGTKTDVAHAKAVLSKIAKTAEDTSVKTIVVDKKFHRALIGPGGNTLRDIVVKAGGPDDRQAQARLVRFPNQGSESNEITVQGSSGIVDKIIASIERIVAEKENQVTEILPVAPEKHRKLIGREGATRRDLEAKFKVTIDIPRQRPGVPQTNPDIKITGVPSAVEECKAHITEMIKEPDGELLEVPRRLHHAIADGGFFKQLQKDFKVTVDHNGIPRPSKPEDPKPSSAKDMPLITDDGSDEKIFWQVVENIASGGEGTYPWVLRGKPEQIEQAKAEIQRAIENAEKQFFTGFLILPDPRKYRLVVGPGGSTVDKIRKETGCRITVPRNQTGGGEAIVLNGDKNGLEQAKDAILKVVAGNDK